MESQLQMQFTVMLNTQELSEKKTGTKCLF